jgi:hypothetical protein
MRSGDLLYTPCGYVVMHSVGKESNAVGIRVGVTCKSDVPAMTAIIEAYKQAGRKAEILSEALELIGLKP